MGTMISVPFDSSFKFLGMRLIPGGFLVLFRDRDNDVIEFEVDSSALPQLKSELEAVLEMVERLSH